MNKSVIEFLEFWARMQYKYIHFSTLEYEVLKKLKYI